MSPLILGSDNFGDATPAEEATRILNRAFDAGINMVDTGDVYAEGMSEKIIGQTVKERGIRDAILIATKVDHGRRRRGMSLDEFVPATAPNMHGHSRLNIIRACEASLKSLQTDYIDLYQLHRPTFDIPLDETLGALDDLVQQHVLAIGGLHPTRNLLETRFLGRQVSAFPGNDLVGVFGLHVPDGNRLQQPQALDRGNQLPLHAVADALSRLGPIGANPIHSNHKRAGKTAAALQRPGTWTVVLKR